jgi:hypothetical protein
MRSLSARHGALHRGDVGLAISTAASATNIDAAPGLGRYRGSMDPVQTLVPVTVCGVGISLLGNPDSSCITPERRVPPVSPEPWRNAYWLAWPRRVPGSRRPTGSHGFRPWVPLPAGRRHANQPADPRAARFRRTGNHHPVPPVRRTRRSAVRPAGPRIPLVPVRIVRRDAVPLDLR